MDDPQEALDRLAGSVAPYLIGVRHHSAVLAAAVPRLLDEVRPDAVLIELPVTLEPWLTWLGDPDTVAPVALAIAHPDGGRLGFYPFADFSPELAALRWARANDVPAHAIDVSVDGREATDSRGVAERLNRLSGGHGTADGWDRLVETPSYGADPERVRRAALAYGWALRADADPVSEVDLVREAHMRRRIAEIGATRPVAVVGSFHAAALLEPADAVEDAVDGPGVEPVTSLIPYSFPLLDSRSGYPAGVRDPEWQQSVVSAAADPDLVDALAATTAARICAELRAAGNAAGTADAIAAYAMAHNLAVLRGLPAPGRGEVIEGVQSALAQGEPLGRARAVAKAAEAVLVGDRRGRVAPGAPKSGLVADIETRRSELKLPDTSYEYRLDPFKSPLDRRRHAALHRLRAVGVDYAEPMSVDGVGGVDSVSRMWKLRWTPRSAALAELAAIYGPDLTSAAAGRLRMLRDRGSILDALTAAAECGLPALVGELLVELDDEYNESAGLPDLIAAHRLVHAIHSGGFAALTEAPPETAELATRLLARAVEAVDGFAGASSNDELAALRDLVGLVDDTGRATLAWRLERIAWDGAPAAQGAASAALVSLDAATPAWLGDRVAAWADHGGESAADRLRGVLTVSAPLVEASLDVLTAVTGRVDVWSDGDFLERLPHLRHGFEALSPAARDRFLRALGIRPAGMTETVASPENLSRWRRADTAGFDAVAAMVAATTPDASVRKAPADAEPTPAPTEKVERVPEAPATVEDVVAGFRAETKNRWRLILGRDHAGLPAEQRRMARTLDELYGHGRGEGSGDQGVGGGTEDSYPSVRDWAEDLRELFGERVREEVLGRAAAGGRTDALLEIDPERVTASVDLLQTVLSLAGALGESRMSQLRRIARRVTEQLTKELAVVMRPALTGLTVPRPTSRPTGRLDLAGTVRRNLRTARRDGDDVTIVAERPVFRSRGARNAEWHIHLVVDVSGSMERSVVYSALTAAILHGVPALSVNFTTFSTQVVDLTDRVSDPLSLLLEVSVGGGTDIGKALAYTRERLTVPSRSIVAVVSDFEEGGSIGNLLGQVRSLAESGATLLGLAALDDSGVPVYNASIAASVADAGMPVAALSPSELASWIGSKVRR